MNEPMAGRRHLAEHAHGEEHEQPADEVRQHRGRPDGADDVARSDEQTRPDDSTQGDHGDMARPQLLRLRSLDRYETG
jgi:hypothetical protein